MLHFFFTPNKAIAVATDYLSDTAENFINFVQCISHKFDELFSLCSSNIGEKLFLGALILSTVSVLFALMSGLADAQWSPGTPTQLY